MRMKNFFSKMLFIALPSIVIVIFLLEVCLKMGGWLYLERRQEAHALKKREHANDSFTILCLGDSFTFGMGASPEKSYPRQLELLLRKDISKNIVVIDEGRAGNTSSLLLKDLKQDIDSYNPDIIVIMTGANNNWNLKDSSYFILRRENLSFLEKANKFISGFQVYKLVKIGWFNFKQKITKVDGEVDDNGLTRDLDAKSITLSALGAELATQGKYEKAIDKFEEALVVDANNWQAHLWLAYIWEIRGKQQMVRDSVWRAVKTIDHWNERITNTIVNQIHQDFEDSPAHMELELSKLKRYLQNKYGKNHGRRLTEIIDTKMLVLRSSKGQNIFAGVIQYDLKQIVELTKEKGIGLILQTYPFRLKDANSEARKMSEMYGFPLVDNEKLFEEKLKDYDSKDFFVADGHCNAQGYRMIAENVYAVLTQHKLIARTDGLFLEDAE